MFFPLCSHRNIFIFTTNISQFASIKTQNQQNFCNTCYCWMLHTPVWIKICPYHHEPAKTAGICHGWCSKKQVFQIYTCATKWQYNKKNFRPKVQPTAGGWCLKTTTKTSLLMDKKREDRHFVDVTTSRGAPAIMYCNDIIIICAEDVRLLLKEYLYHVAYLMCLKCVYQFCDWK